MVAMKKAALMVPSAVTLRMYRSRVTKPQLWEAVMPRNRRKFMWGNVSK